MFNCSQNGPQPLRCSGIRGALGARTCACRVRAAPSRAPVVTKAAKDSVQDLFYNRSREIAALSKIFDDDKPSGILVVTGPSNTGKTGLILQVMADVNIRGATIPTNQQQVFLRVNCRQGDTTNPAAFAALLARQVDSANIQVGGKTWPAWLQQQVQLGKAIVQLQDPKQPAWVMASPLSDIIEFLTSWLQLYPGKPCPVIVIDEANRLRDWAKDDERALQGLLDFFVSISKEQNGVCHVVLATSDGLLADWLETKGIRSDQYEVFTVGNLSQDDIKGYVYGVDGYPGMVNATRWGKDKGFTLPESLWEAAYKRLGGNVGAWRMRILSAARLFEPASDEEQTIVNLEQAWQQALKVPWAQATARITSASEPKALHVIRNEPKWTAEQWSSVLRAIKKAPHHAVPMSSLKTMGVNFEVVRSLLDYNFIALRSPSDLAQDLPAEVYGAKQEQVVTAVNAAQLEYICYGNWDQEFQQVSALEATDGSPGPSRSSYPTSDALREVSDEIKAVQGKIEGVERQIAEAGDKVNSVLAAKGEGWQVQLAYWQQKEQQLADEKRQLRHELQQLRDEELLLLKRGNRGL